MIINLLVWLAFGALAGWIAGKLMDSEKGWLPTSLLAASAA